MTARFDLSFCIPTYNFGKFIGETLDSILVQADERVQIVIVDGGSTDDTAQIVADRARQFANIKFIQREKRCGVDLDILESVAQADGEFCWLFSADDILEPHAIRQIRIEMDGTWDVFLTNFGLCDLRMNREKRHEIVDVDQTETFDWRIPEQKLRYLQLAQSSTAFFSFISGVVVRRSSWLSVPTQTQFVGSCWIIAAQLFALARQGLVIRYYPEELLQKRGENDSFLTLGLISRVGLSIDGFRRVAEGIFGPGTPEALHVSRVLKRETPLLALNYLRLRTASHAERKRLEELIRRQYSDGLFSDWLQRNLLLLPLGLLLAIRSLIRTAKRFAAAVGLPIRAPQPAAG